MSKTQNLDRPDLDRSKILRRAQKDKRDSSRGREEQSIEKTFKKPGKLDLS